jgi:hypothetical protein
VNKLKTRRFFLTRKAEKLIKPRKTHLYNITNIQCTNLKKHRLFTLPLNRIRDVLGGPNFTSRQRGMDLGREAGEKSKKEVHPDTGV